MWYLDGEIALNWCFVMMIEVYEMQVKPRALEMTMDEEIKFTAIVDYLQQLLIIYNKYLTNMHII